jgi:hypothetical protein
LENKLSIDNPYEGITSPMPDKFGVTVPDRFPGHVRTIGIYSTLQAAVDARADYFRKKAGVSKAARETATLPLDLETRLLNA